MPMNRCLYPPDWPAITLARKESAGWLCEWCGVQHGAIRKNVKGRPYKVVLTTAHVGPNRNNKMDTSSLAVLCQVCHLNYDRPDHLRHRRENRLRRIIDRIVSAGQQVLFE